MKEMRIWHDDVRRPPDDTWVWARTNEQAKALLQVGGKGGRANVTEISLDHDLGWEKVDPDSPDAVLLRGDSPDGNGYDLVCWMIENDLVPPFVRVHSWNHSRARAMAEKLNDHGHDCVVYAYEIP